MNLNHGHDCSKLAYGWAKKTFPFREGREGMPVLGVDGGFSNIMKFGDELIGMTSDGIGTKVEIAERTENYRTLGFDLVAMVVDDLIANGLEPVNLSNILDVDQLDSNIVDELMHGLYDAAKVAGVAVTGGEIAELGARISGWGPKMHFNWCSTAIGVVPKNSKIIDGSLISEGDAVITLESPGFRSNGYSLIRKILQKNFGDSWHLSLVKEGVNAGKKWGEVLLCPCRIYTPILMNLIREKISLHGIAHITGGGIQDNLGRILKNKNLGANLEKILPPMDYMVELQKLGDIDDKTAYHQWNMGNGMMLILPQNEVSKTLTLIKSFDCQAIQAGLITKEPIVRFMSQGVSSTLISCETAKAGK